MSQLHPEAQKLADYLLQNKRVDLKTAIEQFAQQSDYDPTEEILPGWCVADVQDAIGQMTEYKETVSEEDAITVLEKVSRKFDANLGVSWFTLQFWADELKGEGAITFIEATPENSPERFDGSSDWGDR